MSAHGHSPFKAACHIVVLIIGYIFMPISLLCMVYTFGAMLLLSQWQLFLWACGSMFALLVLIVVFSILSE